MLDDASLIDGLNQLSWCLFSQFPCCELDDLSHLMRVYKCLLYVPFLAFQIVCSAFLTFFSWFIRNIVIHLYSSARARIVSPPACGIVSPSAQPARPALRSVSTSCAIGEPWRGSTDRTPEHTSTPSAHSAAHTKVRFSVCLGRLIFGEMNTFDYI